MMLCRFGGCWPGQTAHSTGMRDKETTGFSDSNYFYETSVACIDQLADFPVFPTGSNIDCISRT
jgi:hypothetical protein